MKHFDEQDTAVLIEQMRSLGIDIDASEADLLVRHLEWLLITTEAINLTAITDPREAIRLHSVDSAACIFELQQAPLGPLLDIGTGGGFPGLPLAVLSGRETTLLDSVTKKATALRGFVEAFPWPITVVPERAEEHARNHRGHYAVAVARAVAPLPSLLELARPLLSDGGRLICLKGQPSASEVAAGAKVAALLGMKLHSDREYSLPASGEARRILTYSVTGASKRKLPRVTGRAQHQPLA